MMKRMIGVFKRHSKNGSQLPFEAAICPPVSLIGGMLKRKNGDAAVFYGQWVRFTSLNGGCSG
jgi:hypothetical protein